MSDFRWPGGQKCAVSLSYDDGLVVHREHVAPVLEAAGIRGTFYAPARSDVIDHPEAWRVVAQQGHELGNHSLFHPCRREPGYESWLAPDYDLKAYSPRRLYDELHMANAVLRLVDGKTERTYGNTCTNTTIGDGENEVAFDDILARLFVAARGAMTYRVIKPGGEDGEVNLMQLGHYNGDAHTCEQLQTLVEEAIRECGWLVLMMHGIEPETHALHIRQPEHDAFAAWLGQNKNTIWTAPVVDVARFVRNPRG